MKRILKGFLHVIVLIFIELPARSIGMDRLIKALEGSGRALEKKTLKCKARPVNLETLAHIIGIERWGQRRLRVALGEPLVIEEYDGYRPRSKEWEQLLATFRATRAETVSLSKSLRMCGVDTTTRVTHNQFGEVSLLGWLFYLNLHARIEALKIS